MGWQQRNRIESVLAPIGLAHLESRDLGDCIPFVGRLELACEQVLFLHRLRSQARIDATRSPGPQLFCAETLCGIDHVGLNLQVVANEVRWMTAVRMDTAHTRSCEDDHF